MEAKIRRRLMMTTAFCGTLLLLVTLAAGLAGCAATKAAQDGNAPEPEPEAPPINPLTGEEVASWDLITRRPLAVKVENDPKARPQSGIIDADLVYEELVEGGVTRFICIYLSKDSPVIGPDRSARPSDIDICFFLDPLFICSGGASQVTSMIRASGMLYIEEDQTHFWRDRSRRAPHNLYTSSDLLRQYLAEEGDSYNQLPDSGLTFVSGEEKAVENEPEGTEGGEEAEEGTDAEGSVMVSQAVTINIPYKASICAASYQYDAASDSYLHFIQGVAHTDLTTGAQVAPSNVIIQYVTLTSSGIRDVTGAETPISQVIGSGRALVFNGGKVYHATWQKPNRTSPTRFVDENGDDIPLHPGQTWIHLIPEDIKVTYQ